jgi:hypothetical protein
MPFAWPVTPITVAAVKPAMLAVRPTLLLLLLALLVALLRLLLRLSRLDGFDGRGLRRAILSARRRRLGNWSWRIGDRRRGHCHLLDGRFRWHRRLGYGGAGSRSCIVGRDWRGRHSVRDSRRAIGRG